MSTAAKSPTALAIAVRTQDSVVILTADGALDSSSSALLRDSLTRATLEQPSAVIVNVTELQVAEESAWSVFISARWQADFRADVPVLLVCGHRAGRAAVTRTGVARFMPVYPTEKSGEQGHRSARAPQFQAFGRTTARQPEQPSRVTPVGPRMAHPMVTSRAYSSRVGRRQRIRGERAETHRKRPGDADRKRWPNGNHRGFRRQQRSGGSAGVPTEGHRRFRPGDRCRVVPRLGQQSHFVGQDGLGNYWAGEPTLTKPLRPACTSN